MGVTDARSEKVACNTHDRSSLIGVQNWHDINNHVCQTNEYKSQANLLYVIFIESTSHEENKKGAHKKNKTCEIV